jgi:hypothetical protein
MVALVIETELPPNEPELSTKALAAEENDPVTSAGKESPWKI